MKDSDTITHFKVIWNTSVHIILIVWARKGLGTNSGTSWWTNSIPLGDNSGNLGDQGASQNWNWDRDQSVRLKMPPKRNPLTLDEADELKKSLDFLLDQVTALSEGQKKSP